MNSGDSPLLLFEEEDDVSTMARNAAKPLRVVKAERLSSLDLLRGFTILGMIVVDNQGNSDFVYYQLDEGFWNGFRLCNIFFPLFLFIMGVAVPLSGDKHQPLTKYFPPNGNGWPRIVWRSAALVLIGMLVSVLAHKFDFSGFRIMGVLQRLGLCYFMNTAAYKLLPDLFRRLTGVLWCAVYYAIMYGVSVPDCSSPSFTEECNASGYVDRMVLSKQHMIYPSDPEGLVSTLTAALTTMFGLECGLLIMRYRRQLQEPVPSTPSPLITVMAHHPHASAKHAQGGEDSSSSVSTLGDSPPPFDQERCHHAIMVGLATVACVGLGVGSLLTVELPFNKKIWTPSFAFFTGGLNAAVLLVCYFLVDVFKMQTAFPSVAPYFCSPLLWLGRNPLLIFIGMLLVELLGTRWFGHAGDYKTVWLWVYWKLYASWIAPWYKLASLFGSLTHVLFWTLVAWLLDKHNITFSL